MNGDSRMAQVLKDEVKNKIKDSAIIVFTKKGFKKSSIKEIAHEADVSVGNVYRYYKNKEELYNKVVETAYIGITNIMNEVKQSNICDVIIKKHEMNEWVVRSFETGELFNPMRAFISLYRREKPVFDMLVNGERDEYYTKTIQMFINLLTEHFEILWNVDGHNKMISSIQASALSNALVFAVIDVINKVDDQSLDKELIKFVNQLVHGFFYAQMQD